MTPRRTRQISSSERLCRYVDQTTSKMRFENEKIIPALATRAFHLPGNSWCADWFQFFGNNHPLLGICCHHRLHPISMWMRIVMLIGSIGFGLLLTNFVWLWYYYHEDKTLLTLQLGGLSNVTTLSTGGNQTQQSSGMEITQAMVALWTFGSALHAVFDNTIWHISACVCCLPGQALSCCGCCRRIGADIAIIIVVILTTIATGAILLRVIIENNNNSSLGLNLTDFNSTGLVNSQVNLQGMTDVTAYHFLSSYAVELAIALFVCNPIFGTILFSGVLGCGKVPFLGGRPYQVMREQKLKDEQAQTPPSYHTSQKVSIPSGVEIYLDDPHTSSN